MSDPQKARTGKGKGKENTEMKKMKNGGKDF